MVIKMKKKIICFGLVSIFLLTSIFSLPVLGTKTSNLGLTGETLYVDDDNTQGPWDGTSEHPFKEIQDAIDIAESDYEIIVRSGDYSPIRISTDNLIIKGEGSDTTTITVYDDSAVDIRSDGVTIDGFKIDVDGLNGWGIFIDAKNDTKVKNNEIIMKDGRNGITTAYGERNIFSDNKFVSYFSNGFANALSIDGIDNQVLNNFFSGFGDCLFLLGGDENTIQGNTFTNNSNGLYLYFSSDNLITDNDFYNNKRGINVFGSENNILYHNNFFDNEYANVDIGLNTGNNQWYNEYLNQGNYWDDYEGVDDDGDGIGDDPYKLQVLKNIDYYPFIHKNGWKIQAPNAPSVTGPSNVKYGIEYTYSIITTDPAGYDVFYHIDWDDENQQGWVGPYSSGQAVEIKHTFESKGTYYIKVKAINDPNGNGDYSDGTIGPYGYLEVIMPKNCNKNIPLIEGLLVKFLHNFPQFQHLLNMLGD